MRVGERASIAMRDRDVRAQLTAWLAEEYSYDPTTVVCHELAIPRPSARIDVAVINGVLAGFEIKSDLDNLLRLPRQVASFGHVFERATLVTTATHLDKARALLPDWWGLIVVSRDNQIRRLRRGRINRSVSSEHALYLLTRAELFQISSRRKCSLDRRWRKSKIIQTLAGSLKSSAIMHEVREALKERANPEDHQNRQTAADI